MEFISLCVISSKSLNAKAVVSPLSVLLKRLENKNSRSWNLVGSIEQTVYICFTKNVFD